MGFGRTHRSPSPSQVSVLTYGSPAAFHRRCVSSAVRNADVQAALVRTQHPRVRDRVRIRVKVRVP